MNRPIILLFVLCAILMGACAPATAAPTVIPSATLVPPTVTVTATSTTTPTPTRTPRPLPTPNLAATEQYLGMTTKVQEYTDAGYITSTKGSYKHLSSFSDNWAQIGWYQWRPVGYSVPADFIVRTDLYWSSASKTPDLSGCGFVFRLQDNSDHYIFQLGTDGYVYAAHNISNVWADMGRASFGKAQISGKANVTLIVVGNTFTVLVDDLLVKKYTGFEGKLLDGDLAYTIISGSNADYGTRCIFSNTDIWSLK